MNWELQEALEYYKKQGAPSDQSALISLLKEIQKEEGGISLGTVGKTAAYFGIKETYLLAVIRRIPSLRLQNTHILEICDGPNCPKKAKLGEFVEKTYGKNPAGFTLQYVNCMRLCGKGPNIRWDGQIHHGADENLIRSLVEGKK